MASLGASIKKLGEWIPSSVRAPGANVLNGALDIGVWRGWQRVGVLGREAVRERVGRALAHRRTGSFERTVSLSVKHGARWSLCRTCAAPTAGATAGSARGASWLHGTEQTGMLSRPGRRGS